MQTLDRQLTQQIGLSASPTILGLLPVENSDQDKVLHKVTTQLQGEFSRLLQTLYLHPALTSYAVAVAIGKGNTNANFYEALEKVLGVSLAMNQRPRFAQQFEASCRQLGLVMPENEEETHADRYIRSVIFQAGILPYWVEHLADAIKSHLARNPCPDLEDDEQVAHFTQGIADRVPVAQTRLRRTLNSEVGPLVCRAILGAFVAENFDLLPPHYREPMHNAFEHTIKDRIQSPYLRHDSGNGSLHVVLPKQSSRLASPHTCWVLGSNSFNALIERTLAVADLPSGNLQLRLIRLRNQFQDQEFTVKLAPDDQDPLFIFGARDGRRRSISVRPIIELPLGDYHLLIPSAFSTSEDEDLTERDGFKSGSLEIFPERTELEIKTGEATYAIRPRLGAEFVIQDEDHKWLETVDGEELYYGERLNAKAFLPATTARGPSSLEFRIEALGQMAIPAATAQAANGEATSSHLRYDFSAWVRAFLNQLPAGIHEVRVNAEGGSRSFSKRFVYWKGLRRTTKSFGYVCDSPPANFSPATSVGVRKTEKGLEICKDHFGPEVVISTQNPAKSYRLAKPGIWLRLFNPDKLESEALAPGKNIEVAGPEQLIIESGDPLPWHIQCNHQTLAVLKPGHAKRTLNLAPLLSQFGESLSLEARSGPDHQVTLLSFSRANLARQLVVNGDGHSPLFRQLQGVFGGHKNVVVNEATLESPYRATFRIGRSQFHELELRISNFAEGGRQIALQQIEAAEGEVPILANETELLKVTLKAEDTDWAVILDADPKALPAGVYFIELRTRKPDQPRWQPLKVADKHGQSESRLVISAKPACADDRDGWGRTLLLALAQPAPDEECEAERAAAMIPKESIKQSLERLQTALLFKYASPVWSSVQWLETALIRACQDNYLSSDEEVASAFAEVAVASLSAKANASLSIHSTLVFGCQPLLLSAAASVFPELSHGSLIAQSFGEMHKIATASTLKDYAAARFQSGCAHAKFLSCFENSQSVFSNKATEFKRFNYQHYFEALAKESQDLDTKQAEVNADALLSAEHLLVAVTPLNRRLRPLASSSDQDQLATASNAIGTGGQGSLERMAAEIRIMHRAADRVAPVVKERAGIPNYLSAAADKRSGIVVNEDEQTVFGLTIPAETHFALKVSDLVMTLTGLARLCAHRLLDRDTFLRRIADLLGPDGDSLGRRTQRLCLLLSLAPELFAFYMLFWEAVLKHRTK